MSGSREKERAGGLSDTPNGAPHPRVGWVAGLRGAQLLVDFKGSQAGPVAARTTLVLDANALQEAVARRQGAVLLFEEGDLSRPLLIGLLQEASDTPCIDLVLHQDEEQQAEAPPPPTTEAMIDGERVVLEGKDEVVLRCGKASITLRRNGRIVIRGTYLVSRAEGTNRIKGGSVQIN